MDDTYYRRLRDLGGGDPNDGHWIEWDYALARTMREPECLAFRELVAKRDGWNDARATLTLLLLRKEVPALVAGSYSATLAAFIHHARMLSDELSYPDLSEALLHLGVTDPSDEFMSHVFDHVKAWRGATRFSRRTRNIRSQLPFPDEPLLCEHCLQFFPNEMKRDEHRHT